MNRKELIDELAKRFEGNRQAAAHALDSVVDVITRSMSAGEKVAIRGFGAFERKVRDAGEKVPEFRAGKELSEVVSGARDVRDRVTESLAGVPGAAAGAAEKAGRATATRLRAVAEKARSAGSPEPEVPSATAKKAPAKKAPAKKAPAKKAPAKKAATKKTAAKKAPAKKTAAAKKAPAQETAAKKAPAKKAPAKKAPAKKAPAKKAPAKKAPGQ